MPVKLNSGAAYLFTRPMQFNGSEVKAGDRLPSGVTDKKLRMLHNTGRIVLGAVDSQPIQPPAKK